MRDVAHTDAAASGFVAGRRLPPRATNHALRVAPRSHTHTAYYRIIDVPHDDAHATALSPDATRRRHCRRAAI